MSLEWESNYIENGSILATAVHGLATLESIKSMSVTLLNAARQHNAHKFITDCRDITQQISTMEIHNLPQTLLDIGYSRSDYIALVYSETSGDAGNYRFFDNRCFSSNLHVRAFIDYESAYSWLFSASR